MQEDYKYRAFISYSHKDISFARWLHKRIENYKIPKSLREKYQDLPKDLKRSIFRDEEELPTAGSLPFNLEKNLQLSQKLIVICSPNAAGVDKKENQKNWIDEEIKYFKSYHKDGNKKILPIMISGIPHASELAVYDSKDECFPKALRYRVDSNGNLTDEKEEVLAADARVKWYEFNKKRKALIKVIAGVLGVDFADLWERDKKEQRKRVAITFAVVAIFIAVTIYAMQLSYTQNKKNELEEVTKQIANIEYKLNHQELNQTEYLALKQKLKKLKENKKDIKKQLQILKQYKSSYLEKTEEIKAKKGEKAAIEYILQNRLKQKAIKEHNNKKESKEFLYSALELKKAGKYKEANELFKEAVDSFFDYENANQYANFLSDQNELKEAEKIYKELLKIKLTINEYANILNNLALLQDKLNQNQEALNNFKEALKIYRELAKKNPNAFLPDVSMTLNNLANLQYQLNQDNEALKNYEEALKISKELALKNPDAYNSDVADTLNNLASFQAKLNQNQKALKNYNVALKISKELALKNPDTYNSDVADKLNNIAVLQNKLNQNQEALKNYKNSLKIYQKLVLKNPDAYNYYVASTLNNLAHLQDKLNQNQEALKNYKNSLKIYQKLVLKNPDAYNYYVANTLNNLAHLQDKLNQNQEALKNYEEALKISKAVALKNPNIYNPDVATTLYNLIALQTELNQNQKALKNYNEALKIYKELALKNPDTYNSDVAMTLNNLAVFYYEKLNYYKDGFKYYKEALKLYKKLYNKTPNAYGLDYAQELIMGVDLFKEPKQNLQIAKKILLNYNGSPKAEQLLEFIKELE